MAGITLRTFENYVNSLPNDVANDNKLVKIETEAEHHVAPGERIESSLLASKNAESDRIRSSILQSRTAEQRDINNRIRNVFMKAVLAECNVSDASKLPQNVRNAMKLSDYRGFFTLNSSLRAGRNNSTLGRPLSVRRIRAVVDAVQVYKAEQAVQYKQQLESAAETLAKADRMAGYGLCDLNRAFSGKRSIDAAAVLSLFSLDSDAGFTGLRLDPQLLRHLIVGLLPGALDRLAQEGGPVTRAKAWQAFGLGDPPRGLKNLSTERFSCEFAKHLQRRLRTDLGNAQNLPPMWEGTLDRLLSGGLKYEAALDVLKTGRECRQEDFVMPPLVGPRISPDTPVATLQTEVRDGLLRDLPRTLDSIYTFEDVVLFDTGKDKQRDGGFIEQLKTNINQVATRHRGRPLSDQEMAGFLNCFRQESSNLLTTVDAKLFESGCKNRNVKFSFDGGGRIKVVITPCNMDKALRDYRIEATLHEDGSVVVDSLQTGEICAAQILSNASHVMQYPGGDLGKSLSGQRLKDAGAVFALFDPRSATKPSDKRIGSNYGGYTLIGMLPGLLDRLAERPAGTPITRSLVWRALGFGEPPPMLAGMTRDAFSEALGAKLHERFNADCRTLKKELLNNPKTPEDDLNAALAVGLKYESAVALFKTGGQIKSSDFVIPPYVGGWSKSDVSAGLAKVEGDLVKDLPRTSQYRILLGTESLFDSDTDKENVKAGGDYTKQLKAKINAEVTKKRGKPLTDAEMCGLFHCLMQNGAHIVNSLDRKAFATDLSNREITISVDDNGLVRAVLTPRDPQRALRNFRIEMTLQEDGAVVAHDFWMGSRVGGTLANAGKVLQYTGIDLSRAFTGKKQEDAVAVLSSVNLDIQTQFDGNLVFGSAVGRLLLSLLPDVLDKLATRSAGTPVTRAAIWAALELGNPPANLEAMTRDDFTVALFGGIVDRVKPHFASFPAEYRNPPFLAWMNLDAAVTTGLKFESAIDVLSSHRQVQLSDFVAPPIYGEALHVPHGNGSGPEDFNARLSTDIDTLIKDLARLDKGEYVFNDGTKDEILFNPDVPEKGKEMKEWVQSAKLSELADAKSFVKRLLNKVDDIVVNRRGSPLSIREKISLVACLSQQAGSILSGVDSKVFAGVRNRKVTFSFDEQNRIKVVAMPFDPEASVRNYKIEATLHTDGVCIVDDLFVSERLRPVS